MRQQKASNLFIYYQAIYKLHGSQMHFILITTESALFNNDLDERNIAS